MKRIIVTGATSMIGTALIEECIRHDIEVQLYVQGLRRQNVCRRVHGYIR